MWQNRLWPPGPLATTDGEPVSVIDVGMHNRDAGPDFFNSKVRIADRLWCGNVEIHIRASDWYRHGHQDNPAYGNVVLHVVQHSDCRVTRGDGSVIPQLVVDCAEDFSERYNRFISNPANEIACSGELSSLPPVMVNGWLDAMAFERLYEKTDRIGRWLSATDMHWEQTAFVALSRAMGAGINGDAFERMALSIPLKYLHRHGDDIVAVEAMLFGQAGLLDADADNEYCSRLRQEYEFYRNKFGLKPLQSPGWRMSRMRPASFPHRRIAVLALLASRGESLLNAMVECRSVDEARALFDVELCGYWIDRYTFTTPLSGIKPKSLSRSTLDMLVINVVVPMMMAYGQHVGDESLTERAIDLLEHLPPESNRYVSHFRHAGLPCANAMVSQAMVQLHTRYCDVRKCLQCRLGHRMLASKTIDIKP